MTYSRKRALVTGGAGLALALSLLLVKQLHLPYSPYWLLSIGLIAGALAFVSDMFRDEIQRQTTMRAWYYGSLGGVIVLLLPGFLLIASRPSVDAIAGLLRGPHTNVTYFGLGASATMVVQMAGFAVVRLYLRLRMSGA